jgi:hypothetical protein
VPRLRPTENPPSGRPVPPVRVAAPGKNDPATDATLAPEPVEVVAQVRGDRRPAALAWKKLSAPLRTGQGVRVGLIGVTGSGKTTSAVDFLNYLADHQLAHLTIIHDVKMPRPQFEGRIENEADAVISRPPKDYPATIVLRRRGLDHTPDVEKAARVTLHASFSGLPTVLVLDEFARATTRSGKEFTAPSVDKILSEGRGIGASLIWGSQLPQRVPTSAYDQSAIVLHRSGRKVLSYLVDAKVIDNAAAEVVARLGVGEFILATAEEDFDGVIYQTPAP